jgi:chromosome partitioning protein
VALYDPRSKGTEAYFELAGEFLARNHIELKRGGQRKPSEPGGPHPEVKFWPYS